MMRGAPVAAAIGEALKPRIEALAEKGITPTLAIVRIGENEADLSYQRGAVKRCENWGLAVELHALPADTEEGTLIALLEKLGRDAGIDGILLLRPLPKQMNDAHVRAALPAEKDVDGITDASLGGVFTGSGVGFAPCTAEACMEVLSYYGIDPAGRRAVVLGRSLVIGKPVAQLLLGNNATVTLCHRGTRALSEELARAEILVAAAGQAGVVQPDCLRPEQIVLDVGVNVTEDGLLTGDVTPAAAGHVAALTPVPGGIGAVTTAVLAKHLVEAAERGN
ncbi:MAG: bifunctional 5,10-methylenetetrahydrofolate dehydrogenase/5,10-methenyltetrahydrofolate cyclohydrolase [bacterium]